MIQLPHLEESATKPCIPEIEFYLKVKTEEKVDKSGMSDGLIVYESASVCIHHLKLDLWGEILVRVLRAKSGDRSVFIPTTLRELR